MEQQYEQVFRYYIQKLTDNLSAEEEAYVNRMLAEDASFSAIWSTLEEEGSALKAGDYLAGIDPAADLEALKQRRNGSSRSRMLTAKRVAAAAAVLVAIGISSYLLLRPGKPAPASQLASGLPVHKQSVQLLTGHGQSVPLEKDSAIALHNATLNINNGALQYTSADTAQNTLWVPAGQHYRLKLSDGTEVWLNAATRLRFPFRFAASAREVYVEGEAYFKVAQDPQHPFIVHTPLTRVQVLGTSFNINAYQQGRVRTALVEGRVITDNSQGQQTDLRPGYQADYQPAKGFTTGRFDEEDVLSWMNGIYYYHNMPLTELADAASRCYGVRFTLDKQRFAGVSATGLMDRNKLTDFLTDLQTTMHITYSFSGDEVVLK